MVTFKEILKARDEHPERVHTLAVSRALEAAGGKSFAIISVDAHIEQELKSRWYEGVVRLCATYDAEPGRRASEGCAFLIGPTLRRARHLGERVRIPFVFAGPETEEQVCVFTLEGGLERFGTRGTDSIATAYGRMRCVASVQFDCPPWAWVEALMERPWKERRR